MSVFSAIVNPILTLNGLPAYALVGGLVFAEAALFVGFVLPGETAVVLGGVLAVRHTVSLPVMAAVVVLAAIAGDSAGYEVGHRYGPRLLATRIFRGHREALTAAQGSLRRKGGRAVFVARFTAFLRAVMPGLAGTAKIPYRRFLAFNAAGAVTWGIGYTLLGYLAGASYKKIESYASYAGYIFLAVVIVVVAAVVARRHYTKTSAQLPGLRKPDS
jgi:membrane-associated protein